ncbi:MAG: NADPH:quinone reductase-like Zn-dependent oxidoreductase, partial [Yoonia sp.]
TIATVRRDIDLGADITLNTQSPDFEAKAKAALSEFKPRMMLDAVCDQASETLFTLMPNRSRWVSYGKLSNDAPQLTQMGQLIFMGKRIEGFWLTQWFRDTSPADKLAAITDVQTRFADGRWTTDVAAELRLDQVVDGLAAAIRKPDGKTIIVIR